MKFSSIEVLGTCTYVFTKLYSVSGFALNPLTAAIPSFAFVSLLGPAPEAKEMKFSSIEVLGTCTYVFLAIHYSSSFLGENPLTTTTHKQGRNGCFILAVHLVL